MNINLNLSQLNKEVILYIIIDHFHKLILIATKELLTLEKGKIKSLVDRLQTVCKKPQLNTDLYV